MDTKKDTTTQERDERAADSALSASPSSVRLDGSKEFEIIVNDREFIRVPAKELQSLKADYEDFKREALRNGYKVTEYYDPSSQTHLAKFTPPNIEVRRERSELS